MDSTGATVTVRVTNLDVRGQKTMKQDPIFDTPDGLERLVEVMRRLRDPAAGCPWDIEQDFSTIAPYTLEEAYEVADAIERADWPELEGELGDLLLQVVYHGQMGAEAGHFDFDSIARRVAAKMIDRHPHVFADESNKKSSEDQRRDWEKAKASERSRKGSMGVLDDVAISLPALLRAVKLQKRAARVGFDWPQTSDVLDKLVEETRELVEASSSASQAHVHEEFGDLLFVMANLARHLGVDPEHALRDANQKFVRRFSKIEEELAKVGRAPEQSSLEEMDKLWDAAKLAERDATK